MPTDSSTIRHVTEGKSPRILIVRAGAIGDTLMATPLVRALRRTFPEAFLAFICSRASYDVLRYNPHLDQVVPLAYRRLPAWISREKQRAVRQMRRARLDWAIALESHPRIVELALQARAARTIGYANLEGKPGYERVAFDPRRHSIENHLIAAQALGVRPDGLQMNLNYPASFDQPLRDRLVAAGIRDSDCLVGIHAGWGGRGHHLDQTRLRSWPPRNFGEVIRWLAAQAGVRSILTGSRADRDLNHYIAGLAGVPSLNLSGQLSLLEMAALIRRLDVYLTVDSGPAHMAAALGTPLVTLWGPGILAQTAPLAGLGPVRILNKNVPCSPCYGTPLMRTCQDNICMKQITVEEVTAAIQQTLTEQQAAKPASSP